MSPALDVLEMITEAPIASSGVGANELGVEDAVIDDWGKL